jgi:pyruvate dehydrogenase E1 component alpha subunit
MAAHIRAGCLALDDPTPESIFDNVYAEGSSLLDEEREQMTSYLAGFAGGAH